MVDRYRGRAALRPSVFSCLSKPWRRGGDFWSRRVLGAALLPTLWPYGTVLYFEIDSYQEVDISNVIHVDVLIILVVHVARPLALVGVLNSASLIVVFACVLWCVSAYLHCITCITYSK
jgi:hypothetical protein